MSEEERSSWNACRFDPRNRRGHYESYFQRANHPERALGFWIRYTIFSPADRPEDAVGELWAIWFDGEKRRIAAVKQVVPYSRCSFSKGGLEARIGDAVLDGEHLEGKAESASHRLAWSLGYQSPEPPLLLLPSELYGTPLPKAKALVGSPNALFSGTLTVDGEAHSIDAWMGSQNHNWGSQHTDAYAWGQVAGFDGEPAAFLEVLTGQVKLGPLWSPRLTLMVLRLDGREHRLNRIGQTLRARGRYDFFTFDFASRGEGIELSGQIAASADAFVALPYDNPPGGTKTCLNSKIARCQITVRRAGAAPRTLVSEHRAAFEIITDARDHGVPMLENGTPRARTSS